MAINIHSSDEERFRGLRAKEESLRKRESELNNGQQAVDNLRGHLESQRILNESLRQELENHKIEIDRQQQEIEERLSAARSLFSTREKEFELQKSRRDRVLSDREKELQERAIELDNRAIAIRRETEEKDMERGRLIAEKFLELDKIKASIENDKTIEQEEFEKQKINLYKEISKKEEELNTLISSTNLEKERFKKEFQDRIEKTSRSFVTEALEELNTKVQDFQSSARRWSQFGAFSLIVGLVYFTYLTDQTSKNIPKEITWEFITFSVLKGFIGISLLLVLARYAYQLSNHYMQEALKNADRKHAINFGKFYLQTYGASAEWTQVKEAFENWNISSATGFSKDDSQKIDLVTIEKATSVFEKAMKVAPSFFGKSDKDKS